MENTSAPLSDKISNRRNFISSTAKSALAVSLGFAGLEALPSCNSIKQIIAASSLKTGFDQTPLPYSFSSLENIIDGLTMEIHYTKHAAAYSKNLKEAALAEGVDMQKPLEDLLANISSYSMKMRNNAGGAL